MFTFTETIFYGDACPIIANNESIQFDDFEMDQTSVRRTHRCDVLSVTLFIASQAHICNRLIICTPCFVSRRYMIPIV